MKLCTTSERGPASPDCVTSKVEGYAINNLRKGFIQLSHYPDSNGEVQPCDARCVQREWSGVPLRLREMDASGGGHQYNDETGHSQILYWAYGSRGLHWTLEGHRLPGGCGWENNGGALTAYINSGTTTTSTTTTTSHPLVPKVDDALEKIAKLNSDLKSVQTAMELYKAIATENQAAVETMGERLQQANVLIAAATAANANLTAALEKSKSENQAALETMGQSLQQAADSNKLNSKTLGNLANLATALHNTGALIATPEACSGTSSSSCDAPTVSADGTNLVFGAAGGSVLVNTKECGTLDVCQLAQTVEQIKDGLKELL